MRKTLSRYASSLAALLPDQASTIIDADSRTEAIRGHMLQVLSTTDAGASSESNRLWTQVVRATEIQTLWYLRSDLLYVLSHFQDEKLARQQLHGITEMFRGVVPNNQMPNPKLAHLGN